MTTLEASVIAHTADLIAEHGHAVITVPDDDRVGSSFAYTVGRTLRGRAELIIALPVPVHVLHRFLNIVAKWEDDTDKDLRTQVLEDRLDGVLALPLRIESAEADDAPINLARFFYPQCSLLQVVLPDKNGRWPGEPLYSMAQPLWRQRTM